MPHQAVIREDHTTSTLRAVYDASSKLKGPSLNDCLEACESRYTDFFGSLIRFRSHNKAVVTDTLKFLWKEDPFDKTSKLKGLRLTRA